MDPVEDVLSGVQILLLDFDGPVCLIFAGYPARIVAQELRQFVAGRGARLPAAAARTDDPFEVLHATEQTGDQFLTQEASAFLREREIVAAATAEPTPGVEAVLDAANNTGRTFVVVSNNSTDAIEAYAQRVGLSAHFKDCSFAREDWLEPHLLKPNPFLIEAVLMGAHNAPAILIGDSTSDVQAAHAAGVRCIGYANKPDKLTMLSENGADAVITSMNHLAAALAKTPVPPDRPVLGSRRG